MIALAWLLALPALSAPIGLDEATPSPKPPELPAELGSADVPRALVQPPTRFVPVAAAPAPASREQRRDEARPVRAEASAPRTPHDMGPGAPATQASNEINGDLKEAVKTARQWVRDVVPWSDGSGKGRTDPLQHGAGQESRTFGNGIRGEPDLFDEAFKFVKEVLGHPMSWLVMAAVGIGSAAVSMVNRRTNNATRSSLHRESARAARQRRKMRKRKQQERQR